MTILLDTSILIDVLRETAHAREWMDQLESIPSISVVTLTELTAGAKSQREELLIQELARRLKLLPVGHDVATSAGGHMKHFGKSHSVELADALIAATAEHHGLKLATLNVKHFPMFKKLRAPY